MEQQELNLETMKKEEIILLYLNQSQKKKEYQDDIFYTEKALNDNNLDYLTKREYQNDLIDDERKIRIINTLLKSIEEFALCNGIELVQTQKQKKLGKIFQ